MMTDSIFHGIFCLTNGSHLVNSKSTTSCSPAVENMVVSKIPIKIDFPSVLRLTDPFVRFTEELCLFLGFDRKVVDNVVLAVDEALVNAIRHGNKNNPSLTTTIEFYPQEDGLKIVIQDQGEGFSPDEVGDPLHEENLLRRGGRGVFLMQKLVESAVFSPTESGMCVTLFVSYDFEPAS